MKEQCRFLYYTRVRQGAHQSAPGVHMLRLHTRGARGRNILCNIVEKQDARRGRIKTVDNQIVSALFRFAGAKLMGKKSFFKQLREAKGLGLTPMGYVDVGETGEPVFSFKRFNRVARAGQKSLGPGFEISNEVAGTHIQLPLPDRLLRKSQRGQFTALESMKRWRLRQSNARLGKRKPPIRQGRKPFGAAVINHDPAQIKQQRMNIPGD